MNKEIASRYGLGLFSLASENNKIREYQEEAKILKEILLENKDFLRLLECSFVSKEERKEIVKKTMKNVSEDFLNCIYLTIDNNRVKELPGILTAFNSLCNEALGVKEGIVYSVDYLSKDQMKKLNEVISKKEGVQVELTNLIDKDLIGGLKIVVSNRIYDDSIKHHLEEMKKELLNK